ncbi:Imm7 family immunity protein [Halocynthiibacter namhaensis]|uniref:Imm7 family immunity protein n=1 Tax=Halocynthiibacter namhaensis TaxID=1290553 RepID=UPI000690BFDC|nr:Imm7 family immunity protein [Halocynthiibacter namhaensis]
MIELHGWVVLRESFDEEGECEVLFSEARSKIGRYLRNAPDSNLICTEVVQNGAYNLLVNGNFNHKDSRWNYVVALFEFIAKVAVGSYGVLHFFDDEDQKGKDNQFQVLVLKKGQIKWVVDENMSPYFPELEER